MNKATEELKSSKIVKRLLKGDNVIRVNFTQNTGKAAELYKLKRKTMTNPNNSESNFPFSSSPFIEEKP